MSTTPQRVAFVAGATSDIGRAIAHGLAADASIAVHYHRDAESATEIVSELADRGCDAFAVSADVADYQQIARAAEDVRGALGPVSVLVNAAAYVRFERFLPSEPEDWKAQIDITLLGAMGACHVFGRQMAEQGWGRIVNVVAEGALVGEPALAVGSMAKAGVLGLTRTLALELAPLGITVNAVSPGFVPTKAVPARLLTQERLDRIVKAYPAGRLGRPEDIASAVAFLCSEEAGYVTGQTVSVSGGYTVR